MFGKLKAAKRRFEQEVRQNLHWSESSVDDSAFQDRVKEFEKTEATLQSLHANLSAYMQAASAMRGAQAKISADLQYFYESQSTHKQLMDLYKNIMEANHSTICSDLYHRVSKGFHSGLATHLQKFRFVKEAVDKRRRKKLDYDSYAEKLNKARQRGGDLSRKEAQLAQARATFEAVDDHVTSLITDYNASRADILLRQTQEFLSCQIDFFSDCAEQLVPRLATVSDQLNSASLIEPTKTIEAFSQRMSSLPNLIAESLANPRARTRAHSPTARSSAKPAIMNYTMKRRISRDDLSLGKKATYGSTQMKRVMSETPAAAPSSSKNQYAKKALPPVPNRMQSANGGKRNNTLDRLRQALSPAAQSSPAMSISKPTSIAVLKSGRPFRKPFDEYHAQWSPDPKVLQSNKSLNPAASQPARRAQPLVNNRSVSSNSLRSVGAASPERKQNSFSRSVSSSSIRSAQGAAPGPARSPAARTFRSSPSASSLIRKRQEQLAAASPSAGPVMSRGPVRAPPPARPPPPGPSPFSKDELVNALYDFNGTEADELSFKTGDQIRVITRDASGWWTGQVIGEGQSGSVGQFPANHTDGAPS